MQSRSNRSSDTRPTGWKTALVVGAWIAMVAIVIVACSDTDQRASDIRSGGAAEYVPVDNTVFVDQFVIDAWINRAPAPDLDSIEGHAWDLWEAINAPTDQVINGTPLPVWETWYTGEEAFLDNQEALSDTQLRDFDPASQSIHAGALAGTTDNSTPLAAAAMTFNRFNRPMYDGIQQNRYYDRATLQQLDNVFDAAGAAPGQRTIMQFPNTSIMLKPVWFVVPGDRPSMLPYWAGEEPDATTSDRNPSWDTWKQCVLVDPTGKATTDASRVCNEGQPGETEVNGGDYELKRVSTDLATSDFYAFEITEEEVDSFGQFKMIFDNSNRKDDVETIEAGDFAILLAMHVSTREIENWTWQSFWWVPDTTEVVASPPNAQVAPPSVAAPFDQFHMCTAYFMTTPVAEGVDGEPWRCFNPFLETDLTDLYTADRSVSDDVGKHSNCMTCHRVAQFSSSGDIEYASEGFVAPSDPAWFSSGVASEFSWAMAFRNHAGPFVGPTPPVATARSTTTTAKPTTTTAG